MCQNSSKTQGTPNNRLKSFFEYIRIIFCQVVLAIFQNFHFLLLVKAHRRDQQRKSGFGFITERNALKSDVICRFIEFS
jgi:hypothetical protein